MRKNNLINQRFGHLVVTREAPSKIEKNGRKRIRWYCDCDCGTKDVVADANALVGGHVTGCGNKCKLRVKPNNGAAKNTVFLYYRGNAKRRNITFSLTREDVVNLIEQPCFYCGATKSNVVNTDTYTYKYNGIDRIDSNIGYIKNNVVACCKYCNRAKSDMSLNEFKNWINNLVKNMQI